MTAGELFHTVGHECVHVKQFATGEFYELKERWGKYAAMYYAEVLAWNWNLAHIMVTYPGAQGEFEKRIGQYQKLFSMTAGFSMWK